MPYATTSDSVRLYYETTGSGQPLIFVHEFAGDTRSWESQVRFFARHFQCITFNARGYPPSDVPAEGKYSQALAASDIGAVLTAAGIQRAHVIGCSMGAFAALHFALAEPARCISLSLSGIGYGSELDQLEQFRAESGLTADMFREQGMQQASTTYASGPARVQYQNKDVRGWTEFAEQLAQHSAEGAAATMRGLQMQRPSIYHMQDSLKALAVPTLIMTGDEDEPALEPSLALKRMIPNSGLMVFPKTGHAINLEEPAGFNDALFEFLSAVNLDSWRARDPRSIRASAFGVTEAMQKPT